jgi:hypothetical protein
MGLETTIITGNSSVSSVGFNKSNTSPLTLYSNTDIYGRVTKVNFDRTIEYELIQNNLGVSAVNNINVKTGTAKPLQPYKVRLPILNEIVPLVKGPNITVGNKIGQYDNTLYYLDPIGVYNNVNDNQIVKNNIFINTKNSNSSLSINNIKKNQIGI